MSKKLFIVSLLCLLLWSCDKDTEPTYEPDKGNTEEPVKPEDPGDGDDVISPKPTFECLSQKTVINEDDTYQEMEGFAASDCWLPNLIGQYWTTHRIQIARWLFSKNISNGQPQGIGLSMWRVNLGAGTYEQGDAGGVDVILNRAESFLTNDGTYDWNKCAGQRYFMQQALANGCEKFVLFSNSPLVQFTKNGKGFSAGGENANLKDDCYDDFADYMAVVAKHFKDEGYNISHISPVNEPQYAWDGTNQEGSPWKNVEIAHLARELDKSLSDRGIDTKILLAEAGGWDALYSGDSNDRMNTIEAFFNPSSSSYVGNLEHVDNLICGHSYWTYNTWNTMRNVRKSVGARAKSFNVRVWQTEWSMLGDEPQELGGKYDEVSEYDIAIYMSKIIHNDLVMANCSSWSYWTSIGIERWGHKDRFLLIKVVPTGGHYSDDLSTEGSIEATPNLWILGNYSLFVRPKYRRIDIEHNESKDFFGTAYISPDGNQIVAVYTNMNRDKGVTLDNSFVKDRKPKSVYTYTSSEDKQLKQVQFNTKDKVFLDPYSVTTVVYNF